MTKPDTKTKLPDAFSLFKPSFEGIKLNIWTFISIVAIPLILYMVAVLISGGFGAATSFDGSGAPGVGAGISLAILVPVAIAVLLVITPAMTYLAIQSTRNREVGLEEAIRVGLKYVWRYLGYNIVFALLLVGGLILFIVPGLIVLRRYFLAGYYLVDEDLSIRDAMNRSATQSKPFSWAIWSLLGVVVLINFLSFIPYIGEPASFALSILYTFAPAVRYHQIVKHTAKAKA